jgi:predicted tellurium resistance membrane protein TerC
MLQIFSNPDTFISFITLVLMEIVLGVDNIIFISILTGKLPREKQGQTRFIGLSLALGMRILLLLLIGWIVSLRQPLLFVANHGISGRDLILITGGLFLVVKTAIELVKKVKGHQNYNDTTQTPKYPKVSAIIFQIILIDIIFSFDSILTAVGLVSDVSIMIAAVIVSMIFMMFASKWVSDFIDKYSEIKIIALAFLILIGAYLFLEGLHWGYQSCESEEIVPYFKKEYLYFSLVFALICEFLNIITRKKEKR